MAKRRAEPLLEPKNVFLIMSVKLFHIWVVGHICKNCHVYESGMLEENPYSTLNLNSSELKDTHEKLKI